jgi:Putative adhesin
MRRAFWSVTGSVLFAGAVGSGTYNVAILLGHDEYTETVAYDAADVNAIDIANDAGSVTVIGTDTATDTRQITLTARISSGIRDTENRHEIVDGVLIVRASCPNIGSTWCEAKYTLEVPHDVEVSIHSDNDGIRVDDIAGAVDIDGDNGSVRVWRLSGDVSVASDNGDITAEELSSTTASFDTDNGDVRASFIVAPQSVRATSDNGDVTVEVPRGDDAYRVESATDNGSTDIEVRDDPAGERVIVVTTDNGDLQVRYSD